uniref:Uncharacterized protein n=1 Tax=Glossina pallidipes TaxID=7398 RepID=A0A1A9ZIB4_GLOPL
MKQKQNCITYSFLLYVTSFLNKRNLMQVKGANEQIIWHRFICLFRHVLYATSCLNTTKSLSMHFFSVNTITYVWVMYGVKQLIIAGWQHTRMNFQCNRLILWNNF